MLQTGLTLGTTGLFRVPFTCILQIYCLRWLLPWTCICLPNLVDCRFTRTNNSYGVNEVLLASVLASGLFSIAAAQPLVIVGITGYSVCLFRLTFRPITVFNYTVYDIITSRGTPFFEFMCWIQLWSMVMHFGIAILNGCNALKYVTRFSCDIFGFYVATIYIQKGVQVVNRQFGLSNVAAFLSLSIALLVFIVGITANMIGSSRLFFRQLRTFIADYGTPLTVIFFSGFVHIGKLAGVPMSYLPTSASFEPTADRSWIVPFWRLDVGEVFLAIPFAVLLTILFYFDHNVSALITQGTEFPLRKPAGFHWDFFLLGVTTGMIYTLLANIKVFQESLDCQPRTVSFHKPRFIPNHYACSNVKFLQPILNTNTQRWLSREWWSKEFQTLPKDLLRLSQ